MPQYRRLLVQGGTYFFTVVTYERKPIFSNKSTINTLWNCISFVNRELPFKIDAIVILPDHLHTIWTLPNGDTDYSKRWQQIKIAFSKQYQPNATGILADSLIRKREKGIWQRRFWEHLIKDQYDYNIHCDYIHYNPVKHGLADSPQKWKYSSFHSFVKNGFYESNWGTCAIKELGEMNLE